MPGLKPEAESARPPGSKPVVTTQSANPSAPENPESKVHFLIKVAKESK